MKRSQHCAVDFGLSVCSVRGNGKDLHGTSISALILVKGSLVLMIHMYEFRDTVFAGRVPGLIPCLRSTFMVIDWLV
jgi:hypothetical protein